MFIDFTNFILIELGKQRAFIMLVIRVDYLMLFYVTFLRARLDFIKIACVTNTKYVYYSLNLCRAKILHKISDLLVIFREI